MNRWSSKSTLLTCRRGPDVGGQHVCWAQWLLLIAFVVLSLAGCSSGDQSEGITELEAKLTQEAQQPDTEGQASERQEEQVNASQADQAAEPPTSEAESVQEAVEEPKTDASATEVAAALSQTAEAEAAAASAAQAERAATVEPIRAEVASYGVDPNQGDLGFTHPPISIEVTDFEATDFANQNLLTVARDFVLAADVTWDSVYAESGCGFVFRSDGDEENPSQYIMGMTRGAQGHVLFAEQVQGDVDLNLVTDIYANGIDPQFEWQNDTTNRMAVVGRGQEFTLYSNGTRLGTVTGKAGFEEGFVAFIAVNRSGGIRCDYDDIWLWRMN
ncbi:MAG: hypothetical protein JSV68_19825 [Anaerolineaceae bacterium]|nr:MAG: hypothetical protein JSV68_19825 [Anaerolineaceae bacterium]